jgi:hypothetical protein
LLPSQRVALYGFDGRTDLVPYAYFGADEATIDGALDRIASSGVVDDSTNLYGAAVQAVDLLAQALAAENSDPSKAALGSLVFFTDGTDRAGRVSHDTASDKIASSGDASFVIGVSGADPKSLAWLARTGYYALSDSSAISSAFQAVGARATELARRDFLISYCSPSRAGNHKLGIRVTDGAMSAETSIDFDASGFGGGCDPAAPPLR